MTPEDKAHLTTSAQPSVSTLSFEIEALPKSICSWFPFFSRTVPSVHMRQKDKQAERHEANLYSEGSSWLLDRLGFKVL